MSNINNLQELINNWLNENCNSEIKIAGNVADIKKRDEFNRAIKFAIGDLIENATSLQKLNEADKKQLITELLDSDKANSDVIIVLMGEYKLSVREALKCFNEFESRR